jgi:hypothetical protein
MIENVAPDGFRNFSYTPKQTLRLIEAFHRVTEPTSLAPPSLICDTSAPIA